HPRVPGMQGRPPLRGDAHHLPGLSQGLSDPRRHSGDADQRGAALGARRVGAGAATQAAILAGGQGTRLRPLTVARAKPVVPLLNRPFLAYQLALLRQHGVTDVILACSYRVDDVRAALGEAEHLGVRLRYVIEAEPLGTGGGIRNAADLTSGTVWVLNGDVLTDADLSAMRAFHEARGSRTTIFLHPVPDPRPYGLVETAPDGRLQRFREKPGPTEPIPTNTINAGIYLIDASLLARIKPRQVVSVEPTVFPALLPRRPRLVPVRHGRRVARPRADPRGLRARARNPHGVSRGPARPAQGAGQNPAVTAGRAPRRMLGRPERVRGPRRLARRARRHRR